jgi:hypothetical protein
MLIRVLEATMNGPSGTSSRRQTDPRPQRGQGSNDVTGGITIFHPGTAQRSGTRN